MSDPILSYSRLTLSDSSLLGHVDFMKKNGVGLINASPLSMGLLTNYGPPKWHPASEEVREAAAKASLYCQKEGVDLPKIALNFTLSQKDIPITLMGMSSVSEVDRNLAALEQDLTEKEREVKEFILTNYFDPVKEKSWEGREVAKYWRKLKALQEQQK